MAYADYMREYVFAPLGMTHTAPENIAALTTADAEIYFLKKGKLKKDKLNNGSYKVPGAAFRSTPSDLVLLMHAYSKEGFISEQVVADMFKSNRLQNGELTQVGIGWRSSIDAFGHPVMEHAGSWRGARTVVCFYPEEEMSISLMINAESQLLIEETAHIFMQLFRGRDSDAPGKDLRQAIALTHNTKDGPVNYQGNLNLASGEGTMKVDSDNYLRSNEIIPLPAANGYALSTVYGLLYLKMDAFGGKVFAYRTMNASDPKDNGPVVEFVKSE